MDKPKVFLMPVEFEVEILQDDGSYRKEKIHRENTLTEQLSFDAGVKQAKEYYEAKLQELKQSKSEGGKNG